MSRSIDRSIIVTGLGADDALAAAGAAAAAEGLAEPLGEGEAPVAGDEDAGEDVDDLDEEGEEAVAALLDGEQDGLDVVLEEEAGHHALADGLALLRDGVLVGEDGAGRGAAAGDRVDGGHHRHEVLELVEVRVRQVDGAVERVHERRVVRPERELRDDVGEVEGWRIRLLLARVSCPVWSGLLTAVVQVLGEHLGVAVAAGRDVEVALDSVEVEGAVDAAAVGAGAAAETRGPGPASLLAAHGDDVVDVGLAEAFIVPPGARVGAAVAVVAELVDALAVDPVRPQRGVLLEPRGGEDAVAGGVLDVHVQVLAGHAHDHVEVDLHAVAHALLDAEGVVLLALPPPRELGPEEDGGHDEHGDGPFPAARGAGHVLRLRLCCGRGASEC